MSGGASIRERAGAAAAEVARRAGFARITPEPGDLEPEFLSLYRRCSDYTMTSIERMHALWSAARHVTARGLEGAYVECGVWRGGSSMLAALTFAEAGESERPFFLYDTFEGMSEPTADDGAEARREWARHQRDNRNDWCYSPLDEVEANMLSTGLPRAHLQLVKGKVEDTIPARLPDRIALLRLDTDWYESTRHELRHLFPLLEPGGVLIVDDYGHWEGARKAVDEYLAEENGSLLLVRVDDTGRVAVNC